MKTTLFICGFILFNLAIAAPAAVVVNQDWTVNTAIPEGSPVGMTVSQTFTSLPAGLITDVSVDLNISGGYNGGLYGYLVLQDANGNTSTEILLNQVGTTPADPFGSSGAGLNVTLSDSGTVNGNIHNAPGIPTGIWQPDSANTLNGTFGGMTANGTWTLFLADLTSGGGVSTLDSWGLNISATVPEPACDGALAGMLGVAGSVWRLRRK